MLYVIYGTDTKKTRAKLNAMIESLQKKRPDASVFKFNSSSVSDSSLEETLFGANLFAPKNIIVLDGLLADKNTESFITSRVRDIAESEHVCFLIEQKLTKEYLKKLEPYAEKIEEHEVVSVAKSSGSFGGGRAGFLDTFAYADAVVNKDKKKAWILFQKLREQELAPEEIHGVLWWQFKSVCLAKYTKTANEAGFKPFVFNNCQQFAKKWEPKELSDKCSELIQMYHRAHRGEMDFMSALELFSLSY